MEHIYYVEMLVNGKMEGGRNPVFKFGTFEEASEFLSTCLDNGFSAEIAKLLNVPDEEEK